MNFTKEEINELSQEELFFWANEFDKKERADLIRKKMLDILDIQEAKLIEG